ncbi:MAG: 1-(5-phosphoribosyl)-5-((5-phosphoribosylamino)methylideneamino)imidazole-4-carboxamide isomerase, partial [Clostridia bacterium]|nr:1-(5-phosphoribosyl)-5-((5-phosphoribosylamino)methylideneamino)imidazole-4-carboxamide isomerase [Clostridia bacterium]
HLHVVDLDGAKSGKADNAKTIEEIVKKFGAFVEVGGGIRTFEQIQTYIDCGVKRVILGTVAVKNFTFVERAVSKFGESIAVGVDAKDEKVAVNGWTEVTGVDSLEFCRKLKNIGISNVIYTDISKDGMMKGTNLQIYDVLCQTYYPKITASGGISDIAEIEKLKKMGIYGAILGKALYENKIDLRQAVKIAEGDV